jgi:hypothetical protein
MRSDPLKVMPGAEDAHSVSRWASVGVVAVPKKDNQTKNSSGHRSESKVDS